MKHKQPKLNKTRQELIDSFVGCLNEEKLPWRQGWNVTGLSLMRNAVSNTAYHGCNAFLLMMVASIRGYDDPRWCTYKQASDNGWQVKKGAKGAPVEYWTVYDKKHKKNISFDDYHDEVVNKGRDEKEFSIISRTYTVFNANCIDGIPPLEQKDPQKLNDIEMNQFVGNIKDNMQVGYKEFGDRAFYSPSVDTVTMPPRSQFLNQHEFDATLLHELAHATGHESRLNRDLHHRFGSEGYAVEELRAEISSAFLTQYIEIDLNCEHLDNHKAYIQSWSSVLKKDPNILFAAIKDAEAISDYMIELGEPERILENAQEETKKPSLDSVINDAHERSDAINNGASREQSERDNTSR